MGTRSLTIVLDECGEKTVTLFGQFDGHPVSYGAELRNFLAGVRLIDGISQDSSCKTANGLGCLAAQLIARFKRDAGSFYLVSPTWVDHWAEYIYTVYKGAGDTDSGETFLKVESLTESLTPGRAKFKLIYDGPVSKFEPLT